MTPIDWPQTGCACDRRIWETELDAGCVCPDEERVMRAYAAGKIAEPMPDTTRVWCRQAIDDVEDNDSSDYDGSTDADLAHGVLSAWIDYVRDKGLI